MTRSFLLLLALLVTVSVQAQKFEIGLNGGIGYNTAPNITSESNLYIANEKHSGISPAASLKAMYNHRKWQYGIQAEYTQLSCRGTAYPRYILFNTGFYKINYPSQTYFISKEAFPIKLFVNRKITFRRLETYAGLSAGYVLATKCEDPEALASEYYNHVNGNGYSFGLQIGGTYSITKHIGINAEVNGDRMVITVGSATYKLYYFPATVGIRYRF